MNDGNCFVCGHKNEFGLNLNFEINRKERSSSARTTLSEKFAGWYGVVHGGITAAMLDDAIVHACLSTDMKCVTAELKVTYKKAIPINHEITIKAMVTKKIPMVFYAESSILVNGELAAKAEAIMFVVDDLK